MQLSKEVLAVRRAHWLAELSGALRDAHRLMIELNLEQRQDESSRLCARIEALRREVETMLVRSNGRVDDFDPEWFSSPWHGVDVPGSATSRLPPITGGREVPIDA